MTAPRVAAFTPGPPSRRGGAAYAGALLPALARHVDLVLVAPRPVEWGGHTISPDEVDPADFDLFLHFLADDPDHLFVYRAALQWGGLVACHELLFPHLLPPAACEDQTLDWAAAFGEERGRAIRARRERNVATHDEAYLLIALSRA
ncbi:MAG: hypothetical protein LC749_07805, partial [Actinobacteria bacterium]|nr:hypothetical protein [Actinomycetota bacterium]